MRKHLANGAIALFAVATVVAGSTLLVAEPPGPAAPPDLSGRWVLNRRLSEDARQKIREAEQQRSQRAGDERRLPLLPLNPDEAPSDTMDALLDPADELSVEQSAAHVVLDEAFARRRVLRVDGRRRRTDNGTSEVAASWREGRLVVETKARRGHRTTETWEISSSGARLTCTTQLDGGVGGPVIIARAYDRAR